MLPDGRAGHGLVPLQPFLIILRIFQLGMIFQSNFFVNIHVLGCLDAELSGMGRSGKNLTILSVNIKSLDRVERELKAASSQRRVLWLAFSFLPFNYFQCSIK